MLGPTTKKFARLRNQKESHAFSAFYLYRLFKTNNFFTDSFSPSHIPISSSKKNLRLKISLLSTLCYGLKPTTTIFFVSSLLLLSPSIPIHPLFSSLISHTSRWLATCLTLPPFFSSVIAYPTSLSSFVPSCDDVSYWFWPNFVGPELLSVLVVFHNGGCSSIRGGTICKFKVVATPFE